MFTTVMMSTYHDQLNTGFSEACEMFKVRGIESLKYVQEFYYYWSLLLWRHFHAPKHDTAQKLNMIVCFTCKSYGLLGRPWPFKVAKVPRPSAVSLKVWLRKTYARFTPQA